MAVFGGATLAVEIDKTNSVLTTTRSWTAIPATDVLSMSVSRGSGSPYGEVEPADISVVVRNVDGTWDPGNTSGTHYPNLKPMIPLRVLCSGDEIVNGYVTDWIPRWPAEKDAEVEILGTDLIGLLAAANNLTTDWRKRVLDLSPNAFYRTGQRDSHYVAIDEVAGLDGRHDPSFTAGAGGLTGDGDGAADLGTRARVVVGHKQAGLSGSGAGSMIMLVYPRSIAASDQDRLYQQNSASSPITLTLLTAGGVRFQDNGLTFDNTTSLNLNAWNWIALRRATDGVTYQLWVNGSGTGATAGAATAWTRNPPVWGGLHSQDPKLDGLVDELATFDTDIGSANITILRLLATAAWSKNTGFGRYDNVTASVGLASGHRASVITNYGPRSKMAQLPVGAISDSALGMIRKTEAASDGRLLVRRTGALEWNDYPGPNDTPTAAVTLRDDGSGLGATVVPYRGENLGLTRRWTDIWGRTEVSGPSSTSYVIDRTQSTPFRSTKSVDAGGLHADFGKAASDLAVRYARDGTEVQPRVEQVSLSFSDLTAAQQQTIRQLDLGDWITLVRSPINSAAQTATSQLIRIEHTADGGEWHVTLSCGVRRADYVPGVRATGATLSIPNDSWDWVPTGVVRRDDDALNETDASSSTKPINLTAAGTYLAGGNGWWKEEASVAGVRELEFEVNSANVVARVSQPPIDASTGPMHILLSSVDAPSGGGGVAIDMRARQTSGGALNLQSSEFESDPVRKVSPERWAVRLDPAYDRARAYHDANQSMTSGSALTIALNQERWDYGGLHSTSTNTSRMTAVIAGHYVAIGQLAIAANATNSREVHLRLNGSTVVAISRQASAGGSDATTLAVPTIYKLAANDYLEMRGLQDSGSTLNALTAAQYSPEVTLARVESSSRIARGSALSITTGTDTTVTGLSTTRWDDLGAAGTDLVSAPDDGWYYAIGMVEWAANATGYRRCWLLLNDDDLIAETVIKAAPTGTTNTWAACAWYMSAGDTIKLRVHQTSGGNLNIQPSGNAGIELALAKIAAP